MMTRIGIFCIACLVAVCSAADLTRQPNAYGPQVVEAVVNLIRESCLFADDRRFLRRLAYVESEDGMAPRTYRSGYYGGIWQVDQSEFQATQNEPQLATEYNIIRNKFGINWNSVTWSDLRKPLYSGIAAALYTKTQLLGSPLSWKTEEQGTFWGNKFHHGRGVASNFTELSKLLDLGCRVNQEVDLVFVLDTSSSLNSNDFNRALDFIKSVVDGFPISYVQTQVGMVTYSTAAHIEFYFNSHRSKSSVQNAVSNVPNRPGSTATDKGINAALDNIFSPLHGARPDAVKVMVVITDGQSDDKYNTQDAAARAHQAGIVTFSVGVGDQIGANELNSIATDPDCTHAYEVNSFSEIKFMTEEIQKATCSAPLFINTTYSCEISSCPPLAVITNPSMGTTIETNITCGGMNIYSAINNPYPTSAQYEYLQASLFGHPTKSYYNISGNTLFINLQDNQNTGGGANSTGCIATITPKPGNTIDQSRHVKCYVGTKEVPCDESFFNCTEKWNFPNPCTKENILADKMRFPHPYKSNEFLMCDLTGKLYIAICPPGEIYYEDCSQCIGPSSTDIVTGCQTKFVATNITNPCTRETILAGHLFFAYPYDVHKYIHCDIWGKPWVQSCQPGMEWDEGLLTCFTPSPYDPCRHHIPGQPYLYPHYCDPHQYIHCDTNHQSFIQSCQLDYVFFTTSQVCVPPGSYPGTSNLFSTCNGATTPYPITPVYNSQTLNPQSNYTFNNQLYNAPCTYGNIQAGLLYFAYKYNNHNYIQCDLNGRQYLRDCYPNYFDPITDTCVDGSVFVDNIVG